MDISNSKCSDMEQMLDAYLDLELEPAAAQEVESHLALCPACTIKLQELETLVERLQSLPAPVLSRDLADEIGDRILLQKTAPVVSEPSAQVVDMAAARRARSTGFFRPLAYAASFLLVAVAGSYMLGGANLFSGNPADVSKVASQSIPTAAPAVDTSKQPDKAVAIASLPDTSSSSSSSSSPATPSKVSEGVSTPVSITARTHDGVAKSSATVVSSQPAAIATLPAADNAAVSHGQSSVVRDNSSNTLKPAASEDLIADYGEPGVEGVYDFGISTNEDGLYAIKL